MTDHELQGKAVALRRALLRLVVNAGAGHIGGGLSCLDVLNVLYNRVLNVSPQTFTSPTRDRYVQSKGHCVEALYAVLADRGFFPASDLDTVCRYLSHYVGHPTRHIPGVEMNTGALGHGLPICIGMALAAKMDSGTGFQPVSSEQAATHRQDTHATTAAHRVFTVLGDGELAEGSN
jgi:transketolase